MLATNRSMPLCTVIPVLGYRDVDEAARWLCDAFGFTVRLRIGDHRAQLNVGGDGAAVVVAQNDAADSAAVLIRVEDVDSHYARVKSLGAKTLAEPATFPYGERQYSVIDIGGHCWTFSQSVADVDPAEWGGALFV